MMLRRFCISIIVVLVQQSAAGQSEPDLSKYKTFYEKSEAWKSYCRELLNAKAVDKSEYRILIQAAKKGIDMCPADSLRPRAQFYLYTGVAYEYTDAYDSAIFYLKQTIALSQKIRKTRLEATALSRMDNIYYYQRNAEERKQVIRRMKELADTSTDLLIKNQAAVTLGGYYREINDYEQSIGYRIKSIA